MRSSFNDLSAVTARPYGTAGVWLVAAAVALAAGTTTPAKAQGRSDGNLGSTLVLPTPVAPGFYARLEMRQYAALLRDDSDATIAKPTRLEFRPVLGTTFLQGRGRGELTFGLIRGADSHAVSTRRPQIDAAFDAVVGAAGTTQPFITAYLPQEGRSTEADLGLRQFGITPLPGVSAGFSAFYELEGSVGVSSQKERADIANEAEAPGAEYGLTGTESGGKISEPGYERNPSYRAKARLGALLVPPALPAATVALSAALLPTYQPKYVLNRSGSVYSSYAVRRTLATKLDGVYRFGKQMLVGNEFSYFAEGFYTGGRSASTRAGQPRYENILRLEYLLL